MVEAPQNVIIITQQAAPNFGKTSHNARLTCPHGANEWVVFGEPGQRLRMAREMAPAHRSSTGCQCEVATDERELVPA